MKTLYLIRHAKSSWSDPDLRDYDRPLNERGKRDAPRMGKRLKEKEVTPSLVLSSPAKRALSTAKRFMEAMGYNKKLIKADEHLYHADEETLLAVINTINDRHDIVFLFGHNPGLTDFANAITDGELYIDNVPTAGVVVITFNVASWKEVDFERGKIVLFDYPKKEI